MNEYETVWESTDSTPGTIRKRTISTAIRGNAWVKPERTTEAMSHADIDTRPPKEFRPENLSALPGHSPPPGGGEEGKRRRGFHR
jgi:hypothetical protein